MLGYRRLLGVASAALLAVPGLTGAQTPAADPLLDGFLNPPSVARPRVWWHWMNGNVTHQGITRDLEWMSRIGIGGVQNFDASLATPQVVDERLVFMTPPWRDAFRHAVHTADRLGLEMSIAGSPGWSESGGPWVRLPQAMKKLVWSETLVTGGQHFKGRLAPPPANSGRYQDQPLSPDLMPDVVEPAPQFYRDVAVLAFPVLPADAAFPMMQLTSSAGQLEAGRLADGHLDQGVTLAAPVDGSPAWLQWDFGRAQLVQALTLAFAGTPRHEFQVDVTRLQAELQASDDGVKFRSIVQLQDSSIGQRTLGFAPVKARYFRLLLPPKDGRGIEVTESRLHAAPRINRAEEKAAFFLGTGLDESPTPAVAANQVVPASDVIDLSARRAADGTLDWTPPRGQWIVLRLGYSLIGIMNHPASPEGTGLEVDKLNAAHVKSYVQAYLDRYAEFLGPDLMGARGLHGMVNDSWEAGAQNWTEDLPRQFRMRRGYDLLRWLPALTGRIVDGAAASDAFLWDFRRTLGELLTENHYGVIGETLRERGMMHYVEAHETGRALIGDGMDVKRGASVPMSAMWVGPNRPPAIYDADLRESASVAHLYGQNLVAAESFTTWGPAFGYAPSDLKSAADRLLSNGLNRFVIHTSVHQPLDDKAPGVTLGPFGQYFTRQETWAEQAGAWITYLSRSSWLLQQGRFVADVLYYYGEDSNLTALYGDGLPVVPPGYAFDFANPHALTLLKVDEGALTTASGMRYRVLALDPRSRVMSVEVLRRIAALVAAGATVVGDRPRRTPGLADDPVLFRTLVDDVWGTDDSAILHTYGKGRVIRSDPLATALPGLGIAPDFAVVTAGAATDLAFVHRHLDAADLYFVSNRRESAAEVDVAFRITGKTPELWYADTGRRVAASYRMQGAHTIVTLRLDPRDAVFVVFREATTATARRIDVPARSHVATLEGPWQLSFPSGRGAPEKVELQQLESWTRSGDAGVKYFSGTATYRRTFEVKRAWLTTGSGIELDLGVVKNLAEVRVNGRSLGVLWKPPYRIDLSTALRIGRNELEIRVTNLWPNRLIGDKQPGAVKVGASTLDAYQADSPLLESGLLGPVSLSTLSGAMILE